LCLLPLIRGLHYAWGTTITGSSSQWYRTATQLGAAGANLILNAALIPRWSWRGAAVASLLTDAGLAAASWLVVQYLRTRKDTREVAITQTA
jgi:O-antigen/teichoic acid export membrane protein